MVLVQPSSRLASQKPVDRPVSCGEGGGAGQLQQAGAELGTRCQSAQVLPLPHRACPKGSRDTQLGAASLSAGDIHKEHRKHVIPPSVACVHPYTPDKRKADPKGRWYPLSHTMLGSADSLVSRFRLGVGVLPTTPTTSKQNKNNKNPHHKLTPQRTRRTKRDTS